ncbi:hypothetical protein FKG94_27985 [Exilibacterium tricleocarpae]|uniref:Uncharacterized protein n=1 Tax=Exilibacterium tricleocarpae TaxID=2591008 RepID=A0A545SLI6_9GAMM|nr:hypothetical protein [Exilibacterium tricleocarpae]TQV65847.1 hypothetical protein FKG94_27985 [Exilibacterium tricleocarpae]
MYKYLISLFLLLPGVSSACSCLHVPLEQHVRDSEVIFVGVLISTKLVDLDPAVDKEWPYIEGVIKVETVLKGKVKETEIIKTGIGSSDCGILLTTARAYVIFTDNESGYVGSCDASGELPRYNEAEYISQLRGIINGEKP